MITFLEANLPNFLATFSTNDSVLFLVSKVNPNYRKTGHIFKRIKTEPLQPQAQLYAKPKTEQDKARILQLPAAALTYQLLQVACGYQRDQKCYLQCIL